MSDQNTRVEVSLFIYGHDLDPELVTERLALTPEVAARRGKSRHWQGKSAVQKIGVWGYKVKGSGVELLVNQFIAALTSRDNIPAQVPAAVTRVAGAERQRFLHHAHTETGWTRGRIQLRQRCHPDRVSTVHQRRVRRRRAVVLRRQRCRVRVPAVGPFAAFPDRLPALRRGGLRRAHR